jgi:vancomycin resistance protein YoaR
LGIKELIGRGSSRFAHSIVNRIYNIGLASSRFKGVLVAPDEIFSFNQVLGDVSALTGYKQAFVIKDGKTVLGDGGGVCQVSTTLFRAVLDAGLPIVERRAHSYRVGYYEQDSPPGIDATVFAPSTDLKFKNDTPGHLLIQPLYDAKAQTLVFEIYGTDDGRVATTTKPITTSVTAAPPDLYVDDPTLPAGTIKQIDFKAAGARVVFDYQVTRAGEEIYSNTFVSNYRPWQAVFLRGTGPAQ